MIGVGRTRTVDFPHVDSRELQLIQRLATLSEREFDTLVTLASGCSEKQAAKELGIRVGTLIAHRARIHRKLRIHTHVDLVRLAHQAGLAPTDSDVVPNEPLTQREASVYRALLQNPDNAVVSAELGMKVGTVRTHRKAIFKKLGVHSYAALAAQALQRGVTFARGQRSRSA